MGFFDCKNVNFQQIGRLHWRNPVLGAITWSLWGIAKMHDAHSVSDTLILSLAT